MMAGTFAWSNTLGIFFYYSDNLDICTILDLISKQCLKLYKNISAWDVFYLQKRACSGNKNINYGYCLLMRWLLSAALSAEVVGLSTAFKARYACSSFKGHNLLISLCVGSLCLAEFRIMQVCLSREDTWPLDLMFCRSTKHFEKNLESIVTVNEENNKNNNNKLNFNVYTI